MTLCGPVERELVGNSAAARLRCGMSNSERLESDKLVDVYKAHGELEADLIAAYLRDNGVEAMQREPPAVSPLDVAESLSGVDRAYSIYVLERDAKRAEGLVKEFLSASPDERAVDESAAQKPRLDKATIGQLRGELREERRTFELLAWLAVVFLGAGALLWAIWPAWLKVAASAAGFRVVMVILLTLGALFAGAWANKRL